MTDWITDAPWGQDMPIDCTYKFSFGKRAPDAADLPEGWAIEGIRNSDPRIEGFLAAGMPPFKDEKGEEWSFIYLVNSEGEVVATWDEGRWWTQEESEAFKLMLRVPSTFVLAEGIREAQMPRWYRRRKRR